MGEQIINKEEYITLVKGLQDIQKTGLKYKSLTINLYLEKYKSPKNIGDDENSHTSIEIRVFFSNKRNLLATTFYDWDKKKAVLNKLTDLESDLKKKKKISAIIDQLIIDNL